MKIIRKIVFAFLAISGVAAIGGALYFDRKFTPKENYLTVENESGIVPLIWEGTKKNALLLPIHFEKDTATYYLQFDTGSPYTILYSQSIQNLPSITTKGTVAKASFCIGKTKISSDQFSIYNQGNDIKKTVGALNIIGTLGTDVLDQRKTVLNFKENYMVLNLTKVPATFQNKLTDFTFKKRRLIIEGEVQGKQSNFLFDSGTSAFELITNKEVWENLKLKNSKITIEKSKSWDKILSTFTANSNQKIHFHKSEIPLKNVTYVEGYSPIQYAMMQFSGMTGMLGNKIFLNNSLYIDCSENKIGIE